MHALRLSPSPPRRACFVYPIYPPNPSGSSSRICVFKTMLYTLAFSSVNTKLVLRSSPLSASNISADGVALSSESNADICAREDTC